MKNKLIEETKRTAFIDGFCVGTMVSLVVQIIVFLIIN